MRTPGPHSRRAAGLVDLLVTVAIMAVLVGLLLGAIQKVRLAAYRTTTMNNLRQIQIATFNYSAQHGGFPNVTGQHPPNRGVSLMAAILPFLEGRHPSSTSFPIYTDPADPTSITSSRYANCSYAANPLVFRPGANERNGFRDGASVTISFAGHYMRCGGVNFSAWVQSADCVDYRTGSRVPCPPGATRPATFADRIYFDVFPVVGFEGTRGSIPGLTFQAGPKGNDCDPRLAQSPYHSGIIVAFGDGSSRILHRNIQPTVYWSLVTPSGAEVVDWY